MAACISSTPENHGKGNSAPEWQTGYADVQGLAQHRGESLGFSQVALCDLSQVLNLLFVTGMPPRDLERTPCRHPCRAENLLVKVYHNPQRMQNDLGSAFARPNFSAAQPSKTV